MIKHVFIRHLVEDHNADYKIITKAAKEFSNLYDFMNVCFLYKTTQCEKCHKTPVSGLDDFRISLGYDPFSFEGKSLNTKEVKRIFDEWKQETEGTLLLN